MFFVIPEVTYSWSGFGFAKMCCQFCNGKYSEKYFWFWNATKCKKLLHRCLAIVLISSDSDWIRIKLAEGWKPSSTTTFQTLNNEEAVSKRTPCGIENPCSFCCTLSYASHGKNSNLKMNIFGNINNTFYERFIYSCGSNFKWPLDKTRSKKLLKKIYKTIRLCSTYNTVLFLVETNVDAINTFQKIIPFYLCFLIIVIFIFVKWPKRLFLVDYCF